MSSYPSLPVEHGSTPAARRPAPVARLLSVAGMGLAAGLLTLASGAPRPAEAQFRAAGPGFGRGPVAQANNPYQAWSQVKEYTIHYETSFKKSFTQPWEWHGSVHDFDFDIKATADGKLKQTLVNGRYVEYTGELKNHGTYNSHEHWYTPDDTLGTVDAVGAGPSNLGDTYCSLLIDTQTGTYRLLLTDIGIDGKVTFTNDQTFTRDGTLQIPCPLQENVPLPSQRPPLIFSDDLEIDAPPLWLLADPYKAKMSVSYTIGPVGPKPEFLLKPVRAQWIPEPDKTLQATVVPKRPNQAPAPVRFILEEISQEPGTCLNSQEVDTDPDLDFDALANAGRFDEPEITGPNSFRMETDEPVNQATATIHARDYGAWGKLRAEAQVDGQWKPIPVEGSSLGYLTLPVDKDLNKISDTWEKQNKATGKPTHWDMETKPLLDGTPGDGLTLYEEYRGLKAEGKHMRLSPLTKKLVVENRAGSQAKGGIKLLETASKLKVIMVKEGEVSGGRVVNANSSLGKVKEQHALRLTNVSLPEGEVGRALPLEKTGKRPVDCTEVQVDIAQLLASPEPFVPQAELTNTIAHELGHGIGASHHGEAGAPLISRFLGSSDIAPKHIVYGSNGKEITDRPFQIKGGIGGLGGLASGDEACIMCYNSFYQWSVQRNAQGQYRYYAQKYRLPGTRFCTSHAGTGVNAKNNKPAPFFGNAERGNCLAQLCPKDR